MSLHKNDIFIKLTQTRHTWNKMNKVQKYNYSYVIYQHPDNSEEDDVDDYKFIVVNCCYL